MLAHYLDKVFSDPEGSAAIAAAGRERALREYDRDANIKAFESALLSIAGKG